MATLGTHHLTLEEYAKRPCPPHPLGRFFWRMARSFYPQP